MRNTMRTIGKVYFLVIVLAGTALAQNMVRQPSPAVTGPAYDVSVGYSYLRMAIPGAGRVGLNGLNATGSIGLSRHWGATVDSSFLRSGNILGTTHQGYMASLLGGPVFYPAEFGNTRMFVHGLAGAALIDGAVPISQVDYFHGWLLRPAFAFGGGMEHALSPALALRVNGDYLRTTFYDGSGVAQPQNNLRVTVSFVFRLKEKGGPR